MKRKVKTYAGFILLCLLAGLGSWYLAGDISGQYRELMLPPLSPPGIVFPIVWTILYVLMGAGAAMVYDSDGEGPSKALTFFVLQLFFNFFWSVIFFGLGMYIAAFIWLVALFVLAALMVRYFAEVSVTAAYLQLPYLLWLLFAMYLNAMVFLLNS